MICATTYSTIQRLQGGFFFFTKGKIIFERLQQLLYLLLSLLQLFSDVWLMLLVWFVLETLVLLSIPLLFSGDKNHYLRSPSPFWLFNIFLMYCYVCSMKVNIKKKKRSPSVHIATKATKATQIKEYIMKDRLLFFIWDKIMVAKTIHFQFIN